MRDLICISHLRWDFVWQRPQHLLSRLAKHMRIHFVEEPVSRPDLKTPELEVSVWQGADGAQVNVIRLLQPSDHEYWIGHGDPLIAQTYQRLLVDYLAKQGIRNPLLWLYTPMADGFIEGLEPSFMIYDVMDQLSAFKGAPVELGERDRAVLKRADIVFTGGVSLYRDKAVHTSRAHLFPSGVDSAHFASGIGQAKPEDIRALKAPIIGYFGVIDERIDIALIGQIAKEHPEWNIVMIGPVVKIGEHELPRMPNIHYPGMKSYDMLPAYLAHFDVALVPFALSDATRYLSPTKTLEYMAAHKPIVSTPIHDVIELYASVVAIGKTPSEFIAHIEHALTTPATPEKRTEEDRLLMQNRWDTIAEKMRTLIE